MLASLGRWSSENSIEHMETGQFYTDNLLYSSLIFHESLGLPLRFLRSVKTEEDAPTHNTIWARKWNKSEKRNDDIFNDCWMLMNRFHDLYYPKLQSSMSLYLKKKIFHLPWNWKRFEERCKRALFPEKLVYCRIYEKIISTCTT